MQWDSSRVFIIVSLGGHYWSNEGRAQYAKHCFCIVFFALLVLYLIDICALDSRVLSGPIVEFDETLNPPSAWMRFIFQYIHFLRSAQLLESQLYVLFLLFPSLMELLCKIAINPTIRQCRRYISTVFICRTLMSNIFPINLWMSVEPWFWRLFTERENNIKN